MCILPALPAATAAAGGGFTVAQGIGLAVTAGSTLFNVIGAREDQRAANRLARYRAAEAEQNRQLALWRAEDARERGRIAASEHDIRTAQLIGRAQAVLAASGTDPSEGGGPSLVADLRETGDLERRTIINNAEREAFNFAVDATNFGNEGALQTARSRTSATGAVAGALFSGASSFADKWYRYRGDNKRTSPPPLVDELPSFG